MSDTKTVTLLVTHTDETGMKHQIVESTEVGSLYHWPSPAAFINEFAKLYRGVNRGGVNSFIIDNVIIG